MKTFTIIVLFFSISACQYHQHSGVLTYHVKANYIEKQRLDVKFEYTSDENGFISLKFDNSSWGENEIYNSIENFNVFPKEEFVKFDRESGLISIKTKPSQKSKIKYSIIQDIEGPALNQHRNRAIINEQYFHILGMRLFMVPQDTFESHNERKTIKIIWSNIPSKDIFHSSFGMSRKQTLSVTSEELYASFFVGGDFRRYQYENKGLPVYFVTRGNWKSLDEFEIFKLLRETITAQSLFWNDPRKNEFSVSLIPTFETWTENSKSNSVGGSGLTNSFISFASNNPGSTLKKMTWLYNHELLHNWIGKTIKNENEVEQYWFSEGFTDYYTYKLMLRNNKLNTEEYIKILNHEVLIPHFQDQLNSLPNSEITFDVYWSNYNEYQKLPYRRGMLYAFFLDNNIKSLSNGQYSLDNIMMDLLQLALNDKNFRFNHSEFLKTLNKYLDDTGPSSFKKYILEGELIDFTEQLPPGISYEKLDGNPIFVIKNKKNVNQLKQILES